MIDRNDVLRGLRGEDILEVPCPFYGGTQGMMPGPVSDARYMDSGTCQQVVSTIKARTTKQVKLVVVVAVLMASVDGPTGKESTCQQYFLLPFCPASFRPRTRSREFKGGSSI